MADDIDVESVCSQASAGGAGFDAGHVDAAGGEFSECSDECSCFVGEGDHDGGAVVSGTGRGYPRGSDECESGACAGDVCDGVFDDVEVVNVCGA